MKRLLLVASVIGLALFAYVVPLGGRTLVEHARSVFSTHEASEAKEGIARGAGELVGDAVETATGVANGAIDRIADARDRTDARGAAAERLAGGAEAPTTARPGDPRPIVAPPMDEHHPADEARLRGLLGGSAPRR